MTTSTNTPPRCWCGKLLKASASDDFGHQDGTMRYIHDDDTESCPDPAWLLQKNGEFEKALRKEKKRLDCLDEKRDKRVTIYSYSYIGGARDGEIDWCLEYREDTHAGWLIFTGETIREAIDKAMQADEERSE